uniref:hypothetical protein n=1 Tax=Serratia entomophila TaxID=42906 RepID=UPI001F4C4A74|nr:hypothetical protein [Serratia entomophila]ULG10716.1 hypothetical protein 176p2_00053 [Serratia entomophila]
MEFKSDFLNIICAHVVTIDEYTWKRFIDNATAAATVPYGIDTKTGEVVDPDKLREEIDFLTRAEFVEKNLIDSCEPDFYVAELIKGAEEIGEIDGSPVWFNSSGHYFFWDLKSECLLESWLTFPVCPYKISF